jgi:hypothetical protein
METISNLQADISSIAQITAIIEAYLSTKQYNQRTAALEAYWWAATYQLALEHNLDNLLPAFAALQQNMSNLEHNSLNRIRNSDTHTLQPAHRPPTSPSQTTPANRESTPDHNSLPLCTLL